MARQGRARRGRTIPPALAAGLAAGAGAAAMALGLLLGSARRRGGRSAAGLGRGDGQESILGSRDAAELGGAIEQESTAEQGGAAGQGRAAAAALPLVVRAAAGPVVVRTVRDGAGEPVRVLQQGGVYQSATYLGERRFEPVFAYIRGFDVVFAAEDALRALPVRRGRGIQRMLMLGGGGFSYPKHVLTSHAGIHMDVVEADPVVVGLARRYFFLDELEARLADPASARGCGLRIFIGDGRAFLEGRGAGSARVDLGAAPAAGASLDPLAATVPRGASSVDAVSGPGTAPAPVVALAPGLATGPDTAVDPGTIAPPDIGAGPFSAAYDVIINDTFSGREPARCLATVEAARAVRSRLAPGGLYLVNVVSRRHGRDLSFLRAETATLLQVFSWVHVLEAADARFGGEENYLLIATDGVYGFEGDIPYDEAFLGTLLHDA